MVPSTLWTMFHILQSPSLHARVAAEMDAAFNAPGSILLDPAILSGGPLLNSVYRETLRFKQLGPVARVPRKPNYLLAGKWLVRPRTPILSVAWLAGRDTAFWNTGPRGEHSVEAFWAERFLAYPDDPTSGPIRVSQPQLLGDTDAKGAKEVQQRTAEDDRHARLVVGGLDSHYFPFGGGTYRCPGEMLARRLTMSTVALVLRMLDVELVDPASTAKVSSHYARYPLGDHRFDRPVPIRVRRKL